MKCSTSPMTIAVSGVLIVCCASAAAGVGQEPPRKVAREILEVTGVRGGLIVHVGCGDGRLTAALRAGEGCLAHGLDRDPAKVRQARAHIQSLGLYGGVSVDRWSGTRLPYTDNLVNLIVASGKWQMRRLPECSHLVGSR